MIVAVPKEIKTEEYRVGLMPSGVKAFTSRGHTVIIEPGAGVGSGFEDSEYQAAGAKLAERKELFAKSDMIMKVKEPLESEYALLREGQILYTYLHLAAAPELAKELLARKVIGIAYETVELPDGTLPLLTPMSEIAGRLAVQEGAKYLEKSFGGRGILLGGVPGIRRGKVVILGGGIVGLNACKIAVGLGADVYILDVNPRRLAYLDDIFSSQITTLYSNVSNVAESISDADVVIGAVLIAGATAPKLVARKDLKTMKKGSVIVDVAVDQGGCIESTRPTTHKDPVFIEEGVVHYCVANMPGAVALSSTAALTNVTYPYGLMIADMGFKDALARSLPLQKGLNTYRGKCTHQNVAKSLGLDYTPAEKALAAS
ncbi:MAG: alanine dehydrogenase [Planctomycetes bacterium]|nr:alanine dehydrogenase [Planctomycetota bacterium]